MQMTPCDCKQAGWCMRHECEKSAILIELCHRSVVLFQLWEEKRGPMQKHVQHYANLPRCQHRGLDPIGKIDCDLCGGRQVQLNLFTCELFQVCTERRFGVRTRAARETISCAGCEKYTPLDQEEVVEKT